MSKDPPTHHRGSKNICDRVSSPTSDQTSQTPPRDRPWPEHWGAVRKGGQERGQGGCEAASAHGCGTEPLEEPWASGAPDPQERLSQQQTSGEGWKQTPTLLPPPLGPHWLNPPRSQSAGLCDVHGGWSPGTPARWVLPWPLFWAYRGRAVHPSAWALFPCPGPRDAGEPGGPGGCLPQGVLAPQPHGGSTGGCRGHSASALTSCPLTLSAIF